MLQSGEKYCFITNKWVVVVVLVVVVVVLVLVLVVVLETILLLP